MANPMDPVLSYHTSQERQPTAVPEQPNNQPHQSSKQSHAEDHTAQIIQQGMGDSTDAVGVGDVQICRRFEDI